MSANEPRVTKRAMPPIAKDAMSREARRIIAATMTDLGAGELLCTGTFVAAGDQVARARAFLNNRLAGHPAREVGMLLVSELATNSIRHSGSRFFALTATRIAGGGLRIAVIDEGRAGIPHLRIAATDAEDGRGMGIVDVLATRWGIIRRPGAGAAVWFECTP
jgi:anti-sigma regulatory factor (Ser/Thr protein kinase)